MKKFKEFELLTKKIYEKLGDYSIQHDVKLPGKDGNRQIDILIEGSIGPSSIRMIVECKDYKGKLNVTKVDELHSKMQDVNANVAVLVSAKGFSGTAIRKAKRLGIKLCTAHEALSDNWAIKLDLPIIVKEITPELNVNYSVHLEKGQSFTNDLMINDVSIFQAFYKKWNSLQFKQKITEDNVLSLININAPYFMRDANTGEQVIIEDINVKLRYSEKFYFGNFRDIEDTLLLDNITEGRTDIVFRPDQLSCYKSKFAPYDNEVDIPDRGSVVINCAAYPLINNINPRFTIRAEDGRSVEIYKK